MPTGRQKPKAAAKSAKETFAQLDKDGSGTLTVQELRDMLSHSGKGCKPLTDEEIEEVIAQFDTNGDGVLSYSEFVSMWSPDAAASKAAASKATASKAAASKPAASKPAPGVPSSAREAFAIFDKDGSGTLSVKELRAILKRPDGGAPLADSEIEKIIRKFDINGDGELQLEEFVSLMASGVAGSVGAASVAASPITPSPAAAAGLPPASSAEMGKQAAEYLQQAGEEEEAAANLPGLMSRVGAALKKGGMKVDDIIRAWDANGDGVVTLQEWRKSLRE